VCLSDTRESADVGDFAAFVLRLGATLGSARLRLKFVVDAFERSQASVDVLEPLEVAGRDAVGFDEYVGHYGDILFGEQRVGRR
jgi:hypothetical protein